MTTCVQLQSRLAGQLVHAHMRLHQPRRACLRQVAPYDVLIADEALPEEKLRTALGAAAMWTTSHCMPLLPYSCVVLESVPEAEARAHMPSPWQVAAGQPPKVLRLVMNYLPGLMINTCTTCPSQTDLMLFWAREMVCTSASSTEAVVTWFRLVVRRSSPSMRPVRQLLQHRRHRGRRRRGLAACQRQRVSLRS